MVRCLYWMRKILLPDLSRDAPVQKSNFMAYNIHAVWQQEVWAGRRTFPQVHQSVYGWPAYRGKCG